MSVPFASVMHVCERASERVKRALVKWTKRVSLFFPRRNIVEETIEKKGNVIA